MSRDFLDPLVYFNDNFNCPSTVNPSIHPALQILLGKSSRDRLPAVVNTSSIYVLRYVFF